MCAATVCKSAVRYLSATTHNTRTHSLSLSITDIVPSRAALRVVIQPHLHSNRVPDFNPRHTSPVIVIVVTVTVTVTVVVLTWCALRAFYSSSSSKKRRGQAETRRWHWHVSRYTPSSPSLPSASSSSSFIRLCFPVLCSFSIDVCRLPSLHQTF